MAAGGSNVNQNESGAPRLDAAAVQALRVYLEERCPEGIARSAMQVGEPPPELCAYIAGREIPFARYLLGVIRQSGESEVTIYKRAYVDRKLFSKMRSDPHYHPAKTTVIAFALALRLSLAETQKLLGVAGFILSGSAPFDLIIRYFIERGEYDILLINDALFAFDQPLLMM
jgi:hypothetical protein